MRGALLQALICISLTGVIVPLLEHSIWTNITTTLALYVIFPATFAASMAADAFAGERERKTLETLLATPLSDYSIFVGKIATAVTFVVAISAMSLFAAILGTAYKGDFGAVSLQAVGGSLAGAFSASLLITAVSIAIAAKMPVARSAQQLGFLATFGIAAVALTVLERLRIPLNWTTMLYVDAFAFLTGAIALFVAMQRFHRERFFESR